VPMVKKEDGEKIEEYRGVTLLPTLYKLYVSILAERLNEKIERKGIVPQNQTGFKREMGTLDNIFAINYSINSNWKGKERN